MIICAALIFTCLLLLYAIVSSLRAFYDYSDDQHVRASTLLRWRRQEGRNAFNGVSWNWDNLKDRWK